MIADKMRAAFEKWSVEEFALDIDSVTHKTAMYRSPRTNYAWIGWQAASAVLAAKIAHLTAELAKARAEQVVEQEPVRTKLAPVEDEEGKVWQWYFDCAGHYIDVALDDNGKYSVFFRDRVTRGEAWLDQAEEPAIANPQPSADNARLTAELVWAVPDGWQLVPKQATHEMIHAARGDHEGELYLPSSLYDSMLAAAPKLE